MRFLLLVALALSTACAVDVGDNLPGPDAGVDSGQLEDIPEPEICACTTNSCLQEHANAELPCSTCATWVCEGPDVSACSAPCRPTERAP